MAFVQRLQTVATYAACCIPYPASAAVQSEPPKHEDLVTRAAAIELEPVIVTARRRQEELQETPVSVVSLSARELEARSLTNLRALQNFVPNLTFAPSQNVGDAAGNIFIRGIGQEDFLAGTEPGVGIYLDGIYLARTMGALMDLVDIERIEVLRGPQGTLYGRNTIGGAINLHTAVPSADTTGYADVIGGNLGRVEFRAMANAPLSESLMLRLAAGHMSRDGLVNRLRAPFPPTAFTETNDDDEGRDDSAVARLQLRWLPVPSMTIDISLDATRRSGTQAPTHVDAIDPRFGILPSVNDLIRDGTLPGPEITNALVSDDLLESRAGGGNTIDQHVEGIAATATKEIGAHTLKIIASHRWLNSHVKTDLDGTWFPILGNEFRERHRQYSAELNLTGRLGGTDYAAGLFAFGERMKTSSGRGISRADVLYLCDCFYPSGSRPVLSFTERSQTGSSFAAYAQASLPLARRLTATIGGRFSHERKSTDVKLIKLDPSTFQSTDLALQTGTNDGRWNAFTWRAGLEFQAKPDLMLYISAAKGYKSGGFNTRPVNNLPNLGIRQFAPETALTFEGGMRSQWLGRRLRLNATIFQTEYRDIQLRQQSFANGILSTLIENAAQARIRGVEIETSAKLGSQFTASLAYGHLDPRFLDIGAVPRLTLDSEFQRTPRHSFTASFDYSLTLGMRSLTLHGDYSYRSREQFQLLPSRFDQPGYGLLGARMTLRDAQHRWSAALFGTNLADVRYRAAGRGTGLPDVGIANSVIGPPRQVGLEVKVGL